MDDKKSAKKDKPKDTKESKGSKPSTPTATKKKKDPPKETKEAPKKKAADTPTKPSTPATKKKDAPTTPKLKKEPSTKKLAGKDKKEVGSPVSKVAKTAAGKKPTTPTSATKAPTKKATDTKPKTSALTEEETHSPSESEAEATETTPSPTPRPLESSTSNLTADTAANSQVASSEDERSDDDSQSVSKGESSDTDSLDISIHESDLSNGVEDIRTRFAKLLHECSDNMTMLQDLYKDMTEFLKSKGIQVTAPSPVPTHTTNSGSIAVTDALSDAAIAEKRAAMNPALSLSIDSAALAASYAAGSAIDSAAIISGMSAQEKAALRAKALLRIRAIKERVGPEGERAITPDPTGLRSATPELK